MADYNIINLICYQYTNHRKVGWCEEHCSEYRGKCNDCTPSEIGQAADAQQVRKLNHKRHANYAKPVDKLQDGVGRSVSAFNYTRQ